MKFEVIFYNQYKNGLDSQPGYDFFMIIFRILALAKFMTNESIRGTILIFSFIFFGFGFQINFLLKPYEDLNNLPKL